MAQAPESKIEHVTEAPKPSGCEIVSLYDWDHRMARAICLAESGGNSSAIGDNYRINGLLAPSCGLMQVRTLKGRPSCEELLDPKTNMDWAYRISNKGTNFKPWSVFTSGKYLQFLDK